MDLTRQHILGVKINYLTYPKTLQIIKNWIKNKQKKYICVAAVHLVMECQKDKVLLYGVNNSGLTVPDGMPLVFLLNKSQNNTQNKAQRIYGPELMIKICELALKNNWKIFLLGGALNQSEYVKSLLEKKYPKIRIVGFADTPIRPIPSNLNKFIINKINKLEPHIIIIGMGCPYQEKWMIDNINKINSNILIGVGAAFDFLTGKEKQAPQLLQNIGLEWLWRFFQNPKRLWYRYTILNVKFLMKMIIS